MSRLMGKPTICIGENKDADQLRGNHTGKCKSTGASCNALVQIKLRTGVRLKWRKR